MVRRKGTGTMCTAPHRVRPDATVAEKSTLDREYKEQGPECAKQRGQHSTQLVSERLYTSTTVIPPYVPSLMFTELLRYEHTI